MRRTVRLQVLCILFLVLSTIAGAQQPKPGVHSAEEIKHFAPSSYFFAGQSAPVQIRNTVGFRNPAGKLALMGPVDTSGYASDVQQKYQGFFIAEGKLNIEGSDL